MSIELCPTQDMSRMAARLRSPDCTDDEKSSLQSRMKKREELLSPLYHQVRKITLFINTI